jgi:hypothetical protein
VNEKLLLIFVGAGAICYGLISALRLKRSMSWPSVQGRIVTSTKRTQHTDAGKLEDPEIVYEYGFGENVYKSSVVRIGGDMLSMPSKHSPSEADLLLAKYPVGKVVDVYVNPRYPKVACLEKAGAETVFISLLFGALAVVTGVYFAELSSFISQSIRGLTN